MNIITYSGDSLQILCSVKARTGSLAPFDITGTTIVFKAVSSAGTAVTIEKSVGAGITVVDGAAGTFRVDLLPGDTSAVGASGSFKFTIRITVDPNTRHTVGLGTISVRASL